MLVVETVANMSKLKSKCDGELGREFSLNLQPYTNFPPYFTR